MTPTIHVLVIGAIPPLSKARASDRRIGLERWLVLAYPEYVRAQGATR